ncbi:hypothetical protein SRIMM317S_03152 [Streptomyces rimosus subsp. rimosus]
MAAHLETLAPAGTEATGNGRTHDSAAEAIGPGKGLDKRQTDRRETGPGRTGPGRAGVVPRRTGAFQIVVQTLLYGLTGLRVAVGLAAADNVLGLLAPQTWAPHTSWWVVFTGWLVLLSAPSRFVIGALAARVLTRSITPGTYPRADGSICGCGPPSGQWRRSGCPRCWARRGRGCTHGPWAAAWAPMWRCTPCPR